LEFEFEFEFKLEDPPVLDGAEVVVAISSLVCTEVLETGVVVAVCDAAPAQKNSVTIAHFAY
jgi:hypothetical protein